MQITNPQIINGGQTAYALADLYEDAKINNELFNDKEVLLKVIFSKNSEESIRGFIRSISNATNQQSKVDESDRRSNDEIQVKIQELIFDNFGYYYERKIGEFYPGVSAGYIDKDLLIDRKSFIRAYYASKGFPASARSTALDSLFSINKFNEIFKNSYDFKKMLFAYLVHKNLTRDKKESWGNGVRYGKFAIVYAIFLNCKPKKFKPEEYLEKAKDEIKKIQTRWKDFEDNVAKKSTNKSYLGDKKVFDFDGYYKGKTLAQDLEDFFVHETLAQNLENFFA